MCVAAYTQLARQTSALCVSGVQPRMRPGGVRLQVTKGREVYTLKNPPVDTCGGAALIQMRSSARRAVKVLIPRMMETPRLA